MHPNTGNITRALACLLLIGIITTLYPGNSPLQTVLAADPIRYYVTDDADSSGSGLNWSTPTSLPSALKFASDLENAGTLVEIWVAAGTYYPVGTDRSATFTIPGNARLYGGFVPGADLASRNWKTNQTKLSGDLTLPGYTPGSTEDNSYHVVTFTSQSDDLNATLDGFTIQDGNANSSSDTNDPNANGGGIWVKSVEPFLDHLIVQNNMASLQGGGIYVQDDPNDNDHLVIQNSQILNNQADIGGGLASNVTYLDLINDVFYGNRAHAVGGAIAIGNSTNLTLIFASLINNTAQFFWAIYARAGAFASLYSSIVWNNQPAGSAFQNTLLLYCDHSLIPATSSCFSSPGFHNMDVNPQFVYLPEGNQAANLRLQPYSPAINTGYQLTLPVEVKTDLDGSQRSYDGQVDLGAFEAHEVNHAPTLTQTQLTLRPVAIQGSSQITLHELIQQLGASDLDNAMNGGAIHGVAITGYDDAPGVWEYSLDDGITWQAVGPVSSQSALLLQDTPRTWLRFSLTGPFSGNVSLQLRAWDGADQRANASHVDISASGGATPYSAETANASVRCGDFQIFIPMLSR